MRVLWVDLMSEPGEAQDNLLESCSSLLSAGVDVVVAVPHGPLFDRLTSAGVTVFPVSPDRAKKRGWRLFPSTPEKLLRAPNTVFQIMRVVKPDIIHANDLSAFFASYHSFSHIPIIWHVRELSLPIASARIASKIAGRIFASSEAVDEYLVKILSPRILGRIRVIRNDDRRRMAEETQSLLSDGTRGTLPGVAKRASLLNNVTPRHIGEQLAKEYRALMAATSAISDTDL